MFLLHIGLKNKGMSIELAAHFLWGLHSVLAMVKHGTTTWIRLRCQRLMTISAGEWHPREKDAKTRQEECGEKKHGFLHPIPRSGPYLDLAHRHIGFLCECPLGQG